MTTIFVHFYQEDESVAAETESVRIGTNADEIDDRRDSQSRINLDNNSMEQFQMLQDSLPIVNEMDVKQNPEQLETGQQQLVSSTPQTTLQSPLQFDMLPPSHALHRRAIVPQQLNGTQSVTPNGSSRILKLVLAITPVRVSLVIEIHCLSLFETQSTIVRILQPTLLTALSVTIALLTD